MLSNLLKTNSPILMKKKCTLVSQTQMAGEKISKVGGNRRIWCHENLNFTERVIRLEMNNDPMLQDWCDDHPEVCRLDRLQGCMYTRGEEEQCAEQTVSSVVPRSVPRSVQISLQRIPRHCPHLLLLGPNTPNNTQKPGGRSSLFWICNETTYSDTNSPDTYSLHAQASTEYIFARTHPRVSGKHTQSTSASLKWDEI